MQHLYTCQAALELHIEAGMTACGLFPHAQTFEQVRASRLARQPQPTCSRVSPTRQVDGLSLTASSGCLGRQVARTSAGTPEGCNAKRKFTVSCSDAAIHPLSGLSHLGTPAGRRVGSAPRSGGCVAAMARRGPPAGAEYPDSVGLSSSAAPSRGRVPGVFRVAGVVRPCPFFMFRNSPGRFGTAMSRVLQCTAC